MLAYLMKLEQNNLTVFRPSKIPIHKPHNTIGKSILIPLENAWNPTVQQTAVDWAFLEVLCFHIEIQRLVQTVPFKKFRLRKSCCDYWAGLLNLTSIIWVHTIFRKTLFGQLFFKVADDKFVEIDFILRRLYATQNHS